MPRPLGIEFTGAVYHLTLRAEGMLFDIRYADAIIPVLTQPGKPVPNGTRVG